MQRSKTLFALLSVMALAAGLGAQSLPPNRLLIPPEPRPNLQLLKDQLIKYHDCTSGPRCYGPDMDRQTRLAIAYLQGRVAKAKPGEKLALVLDIDETSLSNWEEEKQEDFGYIAKDWNAWVDKKQATAIAGTLHIYKEAVKDGVSVFFITGRGAAQESATAGNLKAVGYATWTGLALRGLHPAGQTTTEYKSGERKKIVDAGYRIVLNVGDQMSDLNGTPRGELSVKLPNPFYYIP